MSQAFTVETGGLGGESVDRVGGGFLIQTAQLDLKKEKKIHWSSDRQHGNAFGS